MAARPARRPPEGLTLRVRVSREPRGTRSPASARARSSCGSPRRRSRARANDALARFLGQHARRRRPRRVRVVRGATGRDKLVTRRPGSSAARRAGAPARDHGRLSPSAASGCLADARGPGPADGRRDARPRACGATRRSPSRTAASPGSADDADFDATRLARAGRGVLDAAGGAVVPGLRRRRTPTWPSRATATTRSGAGWPGRATRRSRPPAAGSCAPSRRRGRRPSRSWPRSSSRAPRRDAARAARRPPRSRAATASRPAAELRSLEAIRARRVAPPRHRRARPSSAPTRCRASTAATARATSTWS